MTDEPKKFDTIIPVPNPVSELKKSDTKVDPKALTQERGATHGDWLTQSATAQRLKTIVYEEGQGLQPYQLEALDMICVKMSRILKGDAGEPDHWDDISGYAYLGKGGHNQ